VASNVNVKHLRLLGEISPKPPKANFAFWLIRFLSRYSATGVPAGTKKT